MSVSRGVLVSLLLCLLGAAGGFAQPLSPEFQVNTYTTRDQLYPAVASDASGNFVVVWESRLSVRDQDGSTHRLFGQRFANTGAPLGPEFPVSVMNAARFPRTASDASRNFVVVWRGYDGPGFGDYGILGRRFASTGAPLGPEFRVNTYTTNIQQSPAVASDPSGNFVVAWTSNYQGVVGQRFASTGEPLGPEFGLGGGGRADVAFDASGNFVVVWTNYDVSGQRFASTGEPLGPEFRVNTYTTGFQGPAAVAADASGNLVVVWTSDQDGSDEGVFGQRFASTGKPLGPEFRVNTYTTGHQSNPAVASDASGDFVVVWNRDSVYGPHHGIFGQRFASTGTPLGPEFHVNTSTGLQYVPAVAADASGKFVVVWQACCEDGDDYGIFGRRYNMDVPVELMHFRVE